MKSNNKLYHKFILQKCIPISIVISDNDLKKLQTIAKNKSFITVEDYMISLINSRYECINADELVKVKNKSKNYDNNIHNLQLHHLEHPKLNQDKNMILDTMQLTLDEILG